MATYTLKIKTPSGRTFARTYWCPDDGGYVRRVYKDIIEELGWQVCEALNPTGNALTANKRTLADVIRRERRKERAAERRGEYTAADSYDMCMGDNP